VQKKWNSGFLNCSRKKTKSEPIFGKTYQFCYFSLNQSLRMLFQSELVNWVCSRWMVHISSIWKSFPRLCKLSQLVRTKRKLMHSVSSPAISLCYGKSPAQYDEQVIIVSIYYATKSSRDTNPWLKKFYKKFRVKQISCEAMAKAEQKSGLTVGSRTNNTACKQIRKTARG
jgi:hypothetical protein